MSNKLGYNLCKILLITFFVFVTIRAYSFEPKATDFINSYQYELYQSWLGTEKLDHNLPAGLTSEKVVKSYKDKNGREINVEYDWQNWKIYSQREIIPFTFYIDNELNINPYTNFLERFIYRLNSNDNNFVFDLLDFNKIILEYKEQKGEAALLLLWEDRPISRLKLNPVELTVKADTLGFKFTSDEMDEFRILFPRVNNIDEIILEIREREFIKSKTMSKITIMPEEDKKQKIEDLTLAEYIKLNFIKPPRRELLNNKITDVHTFFFSEFPHHSISNEQNLWILRIDKFEDKLSGEISLKVEINSDMINIYPHNNLDLENKLLLIGSDRIDMSMLSETEISILANYLPQLIYEHRSIGSKLMNFLLIHDEVTSTLIVRTDKRELYETDSYSDILLLLNEYWQGRTIYFGIDNIKKMNGTIEFKGFLVALSSDGSSDMAEIYFHLSKEFKIDIIMMILHPAVENKR
ncbi:MAG: hypothetical protein P9L97_06515 [Candidatus Tenebribacter davisii]|nr:hypothetical protein [Candidatus Tenebribacter davisii]